MKKLSKREQLFCLLFFEKGNAEEAARLAGFPEPEQKSAFLLEQTEIRQEIARLSEYRTALGKQEAFLGYRRLAFGNVKDAVKLLFAEDAVNEIEKGADLFMISEIKKPKDGSLEIKFFDRLKALEKLENWGNREENHLSDFYQAIVGGQKAREQQEGRENE